MVGKWSYSESSCGPLTYAVTLDNGYNLPNFIKFTHSIMKFTVLTD